MSKIQSPPLISPSILAPVHPAIESYQQTLMGRSDHQVLTEMETRAQIHHFPIVGRLVGVFLETMAKTINARRVFEFGSGYGYSAYWFGKAVGPEGNIVCTDGDSLNKTLAEDYLGRAGLWDRIDYQTGMAQDVFLYYDGLFDICYNDVDKGDYPDIWLMARERIRPGGLYIADNVLWHGRVALEHYEDVYPGWTEAILEHNRLIFDDREFDAFINPTRDGVIVARKKTE